MSPPSLTPLLNTLRQIRDMERRLAKARERRDAQIWAAVNGGMRPAELARRISNWVTESTVRAAVRKHRDG